MDGTALPAFGMLWAAMVVASCQTRQTTVTGYGFVEVDANPSNRIVGLQTTLTVPAEPPASGTLFLWPGLQPQTGGTDYEPIGNGVLQSVLAWGNSCAPGIKPAPYSTWWVSAQYLDTTGGEPAHTGCYGGAVMTATPGEPLRITMTLSGTVWEQTVVGQLGTTQPSVSFAEDLLGQAQNRAEFVIEGYSAAPVSDVVFSDTTITFASPDATDCMVAQRGQGDSISTPEPSGDGMHCFIKEIVLQASGTPADE